MARNPDHYSMISSLQPSMMCSLCEVIGRGVHFNAYAAVGGQEIKYGLISTSALLCDLWTWENMFIAGRLHKPVLVLAEDAIINDAVRANLDFALAAALLLLPEQFSSQALMESICGLSYTGDIRMTWGEDRQKVQRIVRGSWPDLIKTFLPRLKDTVGCAAELSLKHTSDTLCNLEWDAVMEQKVGLPQTELLLSFLPQGLQNSLNKTPNRHYWADAVQLHVL
ncbi:g8877 [Coccomyxa viridis]|uniref:Phosphatidate cytidylyltransferase, mitochondrial n=1 Tax=Coccomyxa viridis TaxID=1274662 RepID=A0ABP1G1K4_9CHLO